MGRCRSRWKIQLAGLPSRLDGHFPCPWLGPKVELTEERERHIREGHQDRLPEHRDKLAEVPRDPDTIRRSARATAHVFSRWYTALRQGRHVAVIVISDAALPARPWIITAYMTRRSPRGGDRMGAKLALQYDREGDILHIMSRPSYREQETEELGDDVVARLNPGTGDVESLEILFFSTRLLRSDLFELPVTADLRRSG